MAVQVEQLITEHLNLWTQAQTAKSTSGRGSNNKIELTGIKKLRELILELAVRGKLVPQDPNDEPASELLKRIAAEKEALVKGGKLKKQKPLPPISNEEKPFELPAGWMWVRWSEIALKIGDIDHKMPHEVENGIPYVSPRDFLGKNKIDFINAKKISRDDFLRLAEKIQPQSGDIIFPRYGTIGANVLVQTDIEFLASYSCCVIKTFPNLISEKFQFYYSISPLVVRLCREAENKTTQPNVGIKSIQEFYFPVPPFSMQNKIAAKVDELLALCDQLEQQSYQQLDAHNQLVDALLATLTQSQNADQLASNWQRLAAHIDTLFTTEYSIDALKQTILQLAVMGKLVKQDPNDEPASELLKRIAAEKDTLVKAGKIKKQKPLPPISDDEKPFELPDGWEWCRLDDICHGITSGSTPPQSHFNNDNGIPYLKVYNIRNQKIDFEYKPQFIDSECHKTKLKRSVLYPGDVVMNIVGPPLGKIAIIPDTHSEWNCNQAIVFFRPVIDGLNHFVYTYLIAGMFLDSIELIGTAGQDNIHTYVLKSLSC